MPTTINHASADEDVKFPPPPPRMDGGGVGDGANYDRVDDDEDDKSSGIKVKIHDDSDDEDANFPPPPPRMDGGGVGDGANYDSVDDDEDDKSHAAIKVEVYDASTDEDVNFPPHPSSREREKRRRVDGGGDDGANFDSVEDNGEESTLLSWVDGNIKSQGQECSGDNQGQEVEGSLSPGNGGMRAGGVDMQNLEEGSLPHTVGERGGVQQSSIEGAPVESDADSVDHVLTEDYDVFDGSISFCCQNCR